MLKGFDKLQRNQTEKNKGGCFSVRRARVIDLVLFYIPISDAQVLFHTLNDFEDVLRPKL